MENVNCRQYEIFVQEIEPL